MKVMKMLFMLLAMILSTLVSFSITAQDIEINEVRTAKFINCDNLNPQQIGAKAKNDFIRTRLPYWNKDKKLLGSNVVAWINNNSITAIKHGYRIPLSVRGTRKDLGYQVIVNCKDETITYQIESD
ncbi:protein YebF [Candidatus Arsenophonus triatominarum]|uniref:protein YebF n=1 Tax=Candidatus Arsenophonus triatominarum TaxID=57911 RepID=UPI0007C52746|nr:protein YebF [Candidatus Arsenophonus triatominarum]